VLTDNVRVNKKRLIINLIINLFLLKYIYYTDCWTLVVLPHPNPLLKGEGVKNSDLKPLSFFRRGVGVRCNVQQSVYYIFEMQYINIKTLPIGEGWVGL
ncbi:MAG: hypothetical protein U5M51_03025, partial [Emticicia sp.]|nr:hypothetical protein [Emticicia sp.]